MTDQFDNTEHIVKIDEKYARQVAELELGKIISFKWASKGYYSKVAIIESSSGKSIFKFGNTNRGYLKDKFASEHFSSEKVPIPKVNEIKQLDNGLWLGVYDFVEGKNSDDSQEEEVKPTIPSVQQCLIALHKTSVESTTGWGELDKNGNAPYSSFVESVSSDFCTQAFYEDSKIESGILNEAWSAVTELAKYAPKRKHLVHNDFGSDNLLVQGGQVTGVLDWYFSSVGDWAMDIASMQKYPRAVYGDLRTVYEKAGFDCTNLNERMKCYVIRSQIGLIDWIWQRQQQGIKSWQTLDEAQDQLRDLLQD